MIDTGNAILEMENKEKKEIIENLTLLYAIPAGSVPLDRELGISQEYLDAPLPVAENQVALEIMEKTEQYEPRMEVEEVTFQMNDKGVLQPIIQLISAVEEEEE